MSWFKHVYEITKVISSGMDSLRDRSLFIAWEEDFLFFFFFVGGGGGGGGGVIGFLG